MSKSRIFSCSRIALGLLLAVWAGQWFWGCRPAPPGGGQPIPMEQLRMIVAGAHLTETVFALGAGGKVAARDRFSLYPPQAAQLPDAGYVHSLNAEGLLGFRPNLVIFDEPAARPDLVALLRQAGVRVLVVPRAVDLPSGLRAIDTLAAELGLQAEGQKIIEKLKNEFAQAAQIAAAQTQKPLTLYANLRGTQPPFFGHGKHSAADCYIQQAGGLNVAEFEGQKALSLEAALKTQVLILDSSSVRMGGGLDVLKNTEALRQTQAVAQNQIVLTDLALMYGLGPRSGQFVIQLANQIQQNNAKTPRP